MSLFLAIAQSVDSSSDGLTLSEFVSNLPHDPVDYFIYLLLIVTIGGILWIGRNREVPPPESPR